MNTITTNKTAAEIRNAIKFHVEGLPAGLTLETLTDIYRCIAQASVNMATTVTTATGRQLKRLVAPIVSEISTIEGLHAAADLIFELADKYTNIGGTFEVFANLDHVPVKFHAAFVAELAAAVGA